ncbi:MAG: class I SAM-dependent rRNA methyltransferase [bacterium]
MITIKLKRKKEASLLRFHPWIFSGAIDKIVGKPNEGDIVTVIDSEGGYLCTGHYQIGSITVRVLTFEEEIIDRDFWRKRIAAAYEMRVATGLANSDNTNAYRLIHGEGDNLPGLIVDIYDNTAVIQAHSVGMHYAKDIVAEIIVEVVCGVDNVYYKSEGTMPFKAPVKPVDEYLIGGEVPTVALENGLKFYANWIDGQKTGFFIDQRDNRALLEHYSRGKNVLNMFCYTGGFSFYAMRGGANLVHSVDSSQKAIDLTNKNIELNFENDPRHEAYAVDAFKYLEDIKDKYDLIVLDPPAFAKHRSAINNALIGYRRLNTAAFNQIKSGGILFTFSCSQAISKEQFRLAVFSAAAQSRRSVRILHQLTQPIDHPVNIYHPEGEYLKGLVLYVE